jgi:hypothetical protein
MLRCSSALVEEHLTIIYSILSTLVLSHRVKVARAACKTTQDIFEAVQCTTLTVSTFILMNKVVATVPAFLLKIGTYDIYKTVSEM